MGDGVAVFVVLPDSGPALAYSGSRERVREVLDRLRRDVEERLKVAGLSIPASGGELPGFAGKSHQTLRVERIETKRNWKGRQERHAASTEQVMEEIQKALEGMEFPSGCFIVSGTEWAVVAEMNERDREMWLRRGTEERAHVKHWQETARIPLSRHQTESRLP